MELRVFRLFVTCYLTCILYRNAVDGSTTVKIFPVINKAFQSDVRMSEIDNTRTVGTETRPDRIISKGDSPNPETPRESPFVQDLSTKTSILNDLNQSKYSRYCIDELGTGKGFEDINLVWSFTNENEDDYFSLESSPKLKILRHLSTDNKSSTILDYCEIYLNLHCDIVNVEKAIQDNFYSNSRFNQQNVEIFKNYFLNIIPKEKISKKLVHRTNLSGYTETNFETDADVTGITINILGNLTQAIFTIPANRTMERPGIVMSLASTYNTKGVAIGARNLPGRWCVKLTGVENSKYNFDVIAYYEVNKENNTRDNLNVDINPKNELNKKKNFYEMLDEKKRTAQSKTSTTIKEIRENAANNGANSLLINSTINPIFERSIKIMNPRKKRNNEDIMVDFSDTSLPSREIIARIERDKNFINHFVLRNTSLMSYGEFKILSNASNKEQQQKIQARSSEVASLNEDIDANMRSPISETVSMQMDSDQSQKFSTQINEDPFERKRILLDVNPNSKLIAAPGTTHRVIFDASNNCVLPVRYAIRATSSPFRIANIQPIYMWLNPGQTDQVVIDIIVPSGSPETVNTLTVLIAGTEIAEKTVNVFVQNAFSKNVDNVKPTIEYSFNSNCAGKLDKDRCEKTLWSADITVQDYDSGLKRVIAIPNGIYSRTKYTSGTKERITFYYISTCCTTTATITAIDVSENQYTRTIDVTAWDNLSQGEIAAIVVGALFLLLLLVLLIVAIVYCVRKRSSHDLPYTQRYGSRQPPRAERTSF